MNDYTSQSLSAILESNDKPVLIDFWAPWCGPCRMQTPILEDLSKEHDSEIIVGKVNIDDNPQLAAQYNVQSIPTMLLFQNGKVVNRLVGLHDKARLKEAIFQN